MGSFIRLSWQLCYSCLSPCYYFSCHGHQRVLVFAGMFYVMNSGHPWIPLGKKNDMGHGRNGVPYALLGTNISPTSRHFLVSWRVFYEVRLTCFFLTAAPRWKSLGRMRLSHSLHGWNDAVDGSLEIRRENQLKLVGDPTIYKVLDSTSQKVQDFFQSTV